MLSSLLLVSGCKIIVNYGFSIPRRTLSLIRAHNTPFFFISVTPVPHPDHSYLCTPLDGTHFGEPADVGQPTLAAETHTHDMVCY